MARRDIKYARKSQLATSGGIDHTLLANIGTNTHAQIDTHIADATLHFTEASIDHGSISGLADDDHSQYHNDARGDARYYQQSEFITTSAGAGDSGKPVVLDASGHIDATMINDADIDHTLLSNIGTNTHAQIDTHIADATLHFTEASIDHGSIAGLADDDHTQYHNDTRGDARYYTQTEIDNHITIDGGLDTTLYYNGNNVLSTTSQGAQLTATSATACVLEMSADVGQAVAVNLEQGTTTKGQFGLFPATNEFTIRVDDTGDDIRLYNVTDGDMAVFEGGGASTLYHGGTQAISTSAEGLSVYDTSGNDPLIGFYQDDGSTRNGFIQAHTTLGFIARNEIHGDLVKLEGEDIGGTARTMFSGDPDGAVSVGYAGTESIATRATGVSIRGSLSGGLGGTNYTEFTLLDASGIDLGSVGFLNGTRLSLHSRSHGASVEITGEDALGTSQTLFEASPDGEAAIYHDGQKVAATTTRGININTGSSGLTGRLNIYDATNTQSMLLEALNTQVRMYSWTHGNTLAFTGEDAGGTARVMVQMDPDNNVQLNYAGSLTTFTTADGLTIRDGNTSGTTPVLRFQDNAATSVGQILTSGSTYFKMRALVNSAAIQLSANNSSGTENLVFQGDPDGNASLYNVGLKVLNTRTGGLQMRGDTSNANPIFEFLNSSGTRISYINTNASTGVFLIRNETHGADLQLRAEDAGGTVRSCFTADPDDSAVVYYNGSTMLETRSTGIAVRGSLAGGDLGGTNYSRVILEDSAGTDIGQVGFPNSPHLQMRNLNHGGRIDLASQNNSGTLIYLFQGDPDSGVGFNGASAIAAPTYTVTNDATDRTYDANSTTLDELADVVGTIIADLQANGLFQ